MIAVSSTAYSLDTESSAQVQVNPTGLSSSTNNASFPDTFDEKILYAEPTAFLHSSKSHLSSSLLLLVFIKYSQLVPILYHLTPEVSSTILPSS